VEQVPGKPEEPPSPVEPLWLPPLPLDELLPEALPLDPLLEDPLLPVLLPAEPLDVPPDVPAPLLPLPPSGVPSAIGDRPQPLAETSQPTASPAINWVRICRLSAGF
jgi:hypothetical protein